MEATINKDAKIKNSLDEGHAKRRKFVKRGKVAAFVVLTMCWVSHFGSISISRVERENRDEAISDAKQYDLVTNGTAFGAFASSQADITQRWANISNEDGRQRREEDHGHVVNFLLLLSFTGLGIFLTAAPKGKQLIHNYIEQGTK